MGELDVYKRNDGKWAWRLVAPNGQIIATDGGQGYENRGDCEHIAIAVVRGVYCPTDLLAAGGIVVGASTWRVIGNSDVPETYIPLNGERARAALDEFVQRLKDEGTLDNPDGAS
jgi:uncharacterized protein YegP (UPF0339 family)